MKEALQNIRQSADALIAQAADAAAVDELRVRFLELKGELTAILKADGPAFRRASPSSARWPTRCARPSQPISRAAPKSWKARRSPRLAAEEIDVTLPGKAPAQGKRRPFEQVLGELKEIFLGMGFDIVSGPEVELDHYNFEMLNMPKSHPARDTQDTFYFTENVLLRADQPHADSHDGKAEAAHPHHLPGPRLPLRRGGRHTQPHFPPVRRPCGG